MSKFPALNIFLAIIFLSILVLPYSLIISSKKNNKNYSISQESKKNEPNDSSTNNVFIILSSIHKPKIIKIYHQEKLIASSSEIDFEKEFVFHFIKSNDEKILKFNIYADWGDNIERSALKIKIEPENMQTRSITLWAEGLIDESIVFNWKL